jgi:hypothetical protein
MKKCLILTLVIAVSCVSGPAVPGRGGGYRRRRHRGHVHGPEVIVANHMDLRVLAISSTNRFSEMPDVPTFKELGYTLEVPSITGDVVPEPVTSFAQYREGVIGRYSTDLAKAGAGKQFSSRNG